VCKARLRNRNNMTPKPIMRNPRTFFSVRKFWALLVCQAVKSIPFIFPVSDECNIEAEAFIHVRFTLKRTTPKYHAHKALERRPPHVQPHLEKWEDDDVSSRIHTRARETIHRKNKVSASAGTGQNKCETRPDEKKRRARRQTSSKGEHAPRNI
jgi:hypothetical protein